MLQDKKLKEEFCVFFDVLGTKSKFLTSNFEEEEKLVKKYENFIKDIKEILINNGFKENEIKLFSDNIFINFQNTTLKEMYDIFRCLAYIQIMAIEKYNFLLRGGVEYSTIYNEKEIVIGKGLVEAVELEKEANYPIIMLGEKAQKENLKKHYLTDKKYIDEIIENKNIDDIKELEEIDKKIKEVNFYVKGNNKENILKVREKYIYLLYYHNSFLRRVFEKDKRIDKNNYDKCFLDVEKEIL